MKLGAIEQLLAWCGLSMEHLPKTTIDFIRIGAAASEDDIIQCERRLSLRPCDQLRAMLTICDGFEMGRGRPYQILGTKDLNHLDEACRWIGVTPLFEEGFIALECCGGNMTVDCYLLSPNQSQTWIGDLRTHVRNAIVTFE